MHLLAWRWTALKFPMNYAETSGGSNVHHLKLQTYNGQKFRLTPAKYSDDWRPKFRGTAVNEWRPKVPMQGGWKRYKHRGFNSSNQPLSSLNFRRSYYNNLTQRLLDVLDLTVHVHAKKLILMIINNSFNKFHH